MASIEVKHWKRNEALKKLVHAAFPGYQKHTVWIKTHGRVTFQDLNWSGGTKSEYKAVDLSTLDVSAPRFDHNPPWAQPLEGKTIDIPTGFAVLSGGHFCGKTATVYIYINMADEAKLGHVTAPQITVTDQHRSITVQG